MRAAESGRTTLLGMGVETHFASRRIEVQHLEVQHLDEQRPYLARTLRRCGGEDTLNAAFDLNRVATIPYRHTLTRYGRLAKYSGARTGANPKSASRIVPAGSYTGEARPAAVRLPAVTIEEAVRHHLER